MFELVFGRRKQLRAQINVIVHGTAHVQKQQHLYIVFPRRVHVNVQYSCVSARAFYRRVHVEFFVHAFPGQNTQSPQGHFHVAGIEFYVFVVVFVFAIFPHFGGSPIPRRRAFDPKPFGIVSIEPKGRSSACSNPRIASVVAVFLLLQQLLKALKQLFQAAHLFNHCLFFVGQLPRQRVFEPFGRQINFQNFGFDGLGVFKIFGKKAVEQIVVHFIFDEHRSAEIIKLLGTHFHDLPLQTFEQVEILADGNGQSVFFEQQKEIKKHSVLLLEQQSC